MGIAERAGRWSAAHWKTATIGWLVLVVVAVAAGSLVGTKGLTAAEQTPGDSARAETILAQAGFQTPAGESVLVRSDSGAAATTPAFRAAVRDLAAALRSLPQVERVRTGTVSKDGRAELVTFDISGSADTADTRVQPVLDAVAGVERSHPGLTLSEMGYASGNHAANEVIGHDLSRAERLSVPVTFLILLVAFGAFVAAGIPVLLAFSAVLATLGLGALVSHVVHASDTTSSIVVLMGMAVGVDYSLFYLKREREERRRGRAEREALHVAAATSGRAVLVSGLTVVVACAGMMLSGSNDFVSLGLGAILVVLVAMAGSLTVLPALLGRLGDRVDRGFVAVVAAAFLRLARREPAMLVRLRDRQTLLHRMKGERGDSRVWSLVLRPALRFRARRASSQSRCSPSSPCRHSACTPRIRESTRSRRVCRSCTRTAPSNGPSPARRALRKSSSAPDVNAPAVRGAEAELERLALARGIAHEPIRTSANAAMTVVRIDMPLAGTGDDATSFAALRTLRSQVIPATLGPCPGVEAAVTGDTADELRLRSHDDCTNAARRRVRAPRRVSAAARRVPLARRPSDGDRAQPALGRRGVRRARVDLPGRAPAGACSASTRRVRS